MPNAALERKLRELGLAGHGPAGAAAKRGGPKVSFRLYFPRAPYGAAIYAAARTKDDLLNFTGLVLGHHGATIQRLQRRSGCKIEVHGKDGNLNGDHPSPADPCLHAYIQGDSKEQLEKAVGLLLEVLSPTNARYAPVRVAAGGSAVLRPEGQPAPAEGDAADAEAAAPSPRQPEVVANAWASRASAAQHASTPAPGARALPRKRRPAVAAAPGGVPGSPPVDIPEPREESPREALSGFDAYASEQSTPSDASHTLRDACCTAEPAASGLCGSASLWSRSDSQRSAASDMSCATVADCGTPAHYPPLRYEEGHPPVREFSLWDASPSLSLASGLREAVGPAPYALEPQPSPALPFPALDGRGLLFASFWEPLGPAANSREGQQLLL